MSEIKKQVLALRFAPDEASRRARSIYEAMLRESRHIRMGNFTAIAAYDLERLYRLYDETFFEGLFAQLIRREAGGGLTFRVSRQMTSAGGKTTRLRQRPRAKDGSGPTVAYELAVSAPLLFQTFRAEERSINVAGVPCVDRLEALQRIMEHEMIHLLEMLVWQDSSCARPRFQHLAGNLFAHTDVKHELVTLGEIAGAHFGIRVGDRVTFPYEGGRYTGRVNRITKRVTVLVEHPSGEIYSDGRRYAKFYVPLQLLEPASE